MPARAAHLLASLTLALAACGGGSPTAPADAPASADATVAVDAAPDAGVDPSAALFPDDHVLEVAITMSAADWSLLRNEPRPPDASNTTCASAATAPGYTYVSGAITVDGQRLTNVALRKKGNFGSLSTARPGLRVKTDEYVAGQRLAGLDTLTLNNNHQDPTLVSQCLGYRLFRAAGLPAPRCAYAHVTVNGEDLGIYSHVETIRKEFLARHFADASGRLYESGGDFVPGGTGGFQPKTGADCSDLDPVVTALAAPADQLEARVGAVVDLAEFDRYWAMEVVTDHWDGYANNQNNVYFYDDPTSGKLHFIPWGTDALFTGRTRSTRPYAVFACSALAWHLYAAPATRARYLAALRDVLATVWDEPAILAQLDHDEALLRPFVDPGDTGALHDRLAPTRAFITGRKAKLLAELDAGDPVWPYAAGEPSCRIDIGTIDASFTTTWGTLGTFGVGSGAIDGTVAGTAVHPPTVFASAGGDSEGRAQVQVLGQLPDGRYAVVILLVNDPAQFTPGTRAIDLANVAGIMTFYDPATDLASGGGLLLPGSLTLTKAATTSGAAVAGTVTGTVLEF